MTPKPLLVSLFSLAFIASACSSALPTEPNSSSSTTESDTEDVEANKLISDSATRRLDSGEPIIYVTVFTHAEQANDKETPDFSKDEAAFWEQRALVVQFAELLYEKGVAYDYQSDWNFLQAALKYDHGTPETNGKNFLQYIHDDLGVSIDPHNHTGTSAYNFADVAYLVEQLGVEPSGVVGGFIAAPVSVSTLEDFWQPMKGNVYNYTWTPTILWGGGTAGHQGNEEDLWTSGVWRPKDAANFSTHDPNAPLPIVGRYSSDWTGLDALLAKQADGELQEGGMYTVSIDAHQKHLSKEFIEEFADLIDAHQQYVDAGFMDWATFPEVYEIWEKEYNEMPTQLKYDGPPAETFRDNSGTKDPRFLRKPLP